MKKNTMCDLSFLEQLSKIPSLSGNEKEIQSLIYKRMSNYSDKIDSDVLGNVFAIKNPDADYKVMLVAHCDEVGFRVNYIDDNGFIFVSPDYGADHRIAPGKRVFIQTSKGPVVGVIGRKARTLQKEEERKNALTITNLWVDIGCNNRKEASGLVKIGDPVMYGSNLAYLRNNLVTSRALDDKIGIFLVMETMRLLAQEDLNVGLYCVSSVQEEAGMRGAYSAAYNVNPQCAIVVDVTDASDIPGVDEHIVGKKILGQGPVLVRGPNVNENIADYLHKMAHNNKLPAQVISRSTPTGTDARVIQISRKGVATGLVYIPLRYMHQPSEVCSLDDVETAVKLLKIFLKSLPAKPDFRPLSKIDPI